MDTVDKLEMTVTPCVESTQVTHPPFRINLWQGGLLTGAMSNTRWEKGSIFFKNMSVDSGDSEIPMNCCDETLISINLSKKLLTKLQNLLKIYANNNVSAVKDIISLYVS